MELWPPMVGKHYNEMDFLFTKSYLSVLRLLALVPKNCSYWGITPERNLNALNFLNGLYWSPNFNSAQSLSKYVLSRALDACHTYIYPYNHKKTVKAIQELRKLEK